MTNLFVIIINFNNKKVIVSCLESLIKNYPKINIIVVDNASSDDPQEIVESVIRNQQSGFSKKSPNPNYQPLATIRLIRNQTNLGFAKGVNKGLKLALKQGAEEVLLLNPDTLVNKGFLEPLLASPAEIVGPILKFQRKGQFVHDFGGKVNWWLGKSYHLEFRSQELGVRSQKEIDYVSGCCMLIRRKVFEKIGFLNEKYFLFFEDSDFCLRAQKAGFKVALEPKSMIFHKLAEGKAKPWRYFYHLLRSNLIFINTWIPFYRRPIAYFYLWLLGVKMLLNRL